MNYRVKYLPETAIDRAEIKDYLAKYYESTVRNFFVLLKERIGQLKKFPYSCPTYDDDPDYRKLVVGDYLVFYMVDESNKIVEIHRIFHGSQDIKRHLTVSSAN